MDGTTTALAGCALKYPPSMNSVLMLNFMTCFEEEEVFAFAAAASADSSLLTSTYSSAEEPDRREGSDVLLRLAMDVSCIILLTLRVELVVGGW